MSRNESIVEDATLEWFHLRQGYGGQVKEQSRGARTLIPIHRKEAELMSNNQPAPGGRAKRNTAVSLVRSSAAEYLTFVATSGQSGVEAVYAEENV